LPPQPRRHSPARDGFADLRLAVISPFLDRRHGTERCLAEQLTRFATQPDAEIHLYAQRVEDLSNVIRYPARSSGCIVWHRVPRLGGPHLFGYIWWFLANHLQRWWDRNVRGLKFDLLYSAGINAFDADAISIHVIFGEFYRRVRTSLRYRDASVYSWPVILHRRVYYRLICWLEKRVYPHSRISLTGISQHTATFARELFQRADVIVIRYGVDTKIFHPRTCSERRKSSRTALRILPGEFCLLLIGNDWKSKGLSSLLQAISANPEIPFRLLVVGKDDHRGHAETIRTLHLTSKVSLLKSSPDVIQFYAAADIYVGPSLEDAYGLPILEAMACGLPVIASVRAGASEIIRDGENGLLLHDPENSRELAGLLGRLYSDRAFREKLADEAVRTAAGESWDRNAASTWEFLKVVYARKAQLSRFSAGT